MLAKVISGAVLGVDGLQVEVEVDIASGLPAFSTVGLPEGAVRESKDRVKAAIKNSGYEFPNRRITVNLAPADVKKAGSGYDLPIAIGILTAAQTLRSERLPRFMVAGELSLDGSIRPVPGILPMTMAARNAGLAGIIVPAENAGEAAVVSGLEVIGVSALHEAVEFLTGHRTIAPVTIDMDAIFASQSSYDVDFAEVKGQENVKRAMEIAATGGHNVLMSGCPGAGKTMIARRVPTILPGLSFEEALETTKVYSVLGLLPQCQGLVTTRPFRSPHHTISDAGLIGGGQTPRPGEVSLAHNGVLFLDELPEFKKHVLEVLRQPLEDGTVTIARAAASLSFPSRFILIAAMNPCPCGFLGDPRHDCGCTSAQIQKYESRLSGPLLDRIDLHVTVPAVPFQELSSLEEGEDSTVIRTRVIAARQIQRQRFQHCRRRYCNSQMGPKEIKKFCHLDHQGQMLLEQAMKSLGLSARAYHRILKIARTIADLAATEEIMPAHVAEAIQYRRAGR